MSHPSWLEKSVLLAALLLMAAAGCVGAPTPVPPPTGISSTTPVTVRQLLDGSERYAGQTLTLTGTIILECSEGCWFFLDDGTGKIYVDLKPAGLTIPQKVGSRIVLCGKAKGTGGNLQIQGEEVRFIGE